MQNICSKFFHYTLLLPRKCYMLIEAYACITYVYIFSNLYFLQDYSKTKTVKFYFHRFNGFNDFGL